MARKIDLDSADISVKKIERLSIFLVLMASLVAGAFINLIIALSIFVGGLVANLSFIIMKRDIVKAMQGALSAVKAVFLIKYYARVALLALVMFFIIRSGQFNIYGLLIGLSSIVIAIAYHAICESDIFFSGSKKKVLDSGVSA